MSRPRCRWPSISSNAWCDPAAQILTPADRHVEMFTSYCLDLALEGNDIPDAYLSALAVEQRAIFVTGDRGFRRFRDLRVLRPGES